MRPKPMDRRAAAQGAKLLTKDEAVIRIRLRSFHRLRSMWGLRLRNRLLRSLRYLASVDCASSG